ncbi:Homoserine/homoserine lactone efflux protein [Pseudodesulfovibrio hydrargyri]|uniref:Homoserine/homoserine lactone efflux protein n=1 Tax=Pseudodesulfovibrio hydrargyri TaxID=2125990 RepID=A0A1J5MVK0_9BACT|nr:LysE family translocator [Pseudodesulfovibrio hydrargyri]OIQ49820.1 Homoserine/homoserine lactone efflux protein [Pseudodesulfovibrio hydrargyri]
MNMETYAAFVLFVIVMTGTPGAGNLTMMGIGQTTGFKSAIPFLIGATVGAVSLDTMVALGLGKIIQTSPNLATVMKVCGTCYILYLGWKLLTMRLGSHAVNRRFTFWEGVILHPLNPKSWAMALVGFTQFADPSLPLLWQVSVFVLTFMVFQVSFHSAWGLAGAAILRTLKSGAVLTGVNCVLVAVMVGATMYALFV